jgi:hypothetical protein
MMLISPRVPVATALTAFKGEVSTVAREDMNIAVENESTIEELRC